MSYVKLIYHVVFRTKNSDMSIPAAHEEDLYRYIWGYVKNMQGKLYRIGGMPDHLHLLLSLPPELSITNFMRDLKTLTSKYLKSNPDFPDFQGWGEKYAAFSYSANDIPVIARYIENQKEHHKTISFADEYRDFILKNGGCIDDRFFLKN